MTVKYIASDGTDFNNEVDCSIYEECLSLFETPEFWKPSHKEVFNGMFAYLIEKAPHLLYMTVVSNGTVEPLELETKRTVIKQTIEAYAKISDSQTSPLFIIEDVATGKRSMLHKMLQELNATIINRTEQIEQMQTELDNYNMQKNNLSKINSMFEIKSDEVLTSEE